MKELKSTILLIGRVFYSRYCLFVFNGFFLAACFFFSIHDNFERGLIKAMANNVREGYSSYASEDSLLLGGLRLTYFLTERRKEVFEKEDLNDVYTDILRPVTYDLMTAKGACGSYSMVLGSILQNLGFEIRFAQMKVDNVWGGHILIEAKAKYGWVILDPSFNLSFLRPDGHLASFNDVKNNWGFYSKQLPIDYVKEYAYADVRYTNWNKIPIVLPALKLILNGTMGEKAANDLSIRIFFIRKFRILYYIAMVLYVFSWFLIFKRYRRKRSAARATVSSSMNTDQRQVYKRA
jgi:hypothetical protein